MRTEVISLRTAIDADITAIDRLLAQSYARLLKDSYPPSVQVTAIPIISRANPALITGGSYYVAVTQEDEIVGAGGWTRSIKGGGVADVRHLVTHHAHTRRGIARRIMMGVFSEARQAGVRQLDCLSTRMAVPFYESMGFMVEGAVTVGLRPGIDFPAIRMVRDL